MIRLGKIGDFMKAQIGLLELYVGTRACVNDSDAPSFSGPSAPLVESAGKRLLYFFGPRAWREPDGDEGDGERMYSGVGC